MKTPTLLLYLTTVSLLVSNSQASDKLSFLNRAINLENIRQIVSPDRAWMAATRSIPNRGLIWKLDESIGFTLVIWPYDNDKLFGEKFLRWDDTERNTIRKIAWSPDSEYLVLITYSSGGHSPWHFPSYVFCVSDNTVRSLDDADGSVLSDEFTFTDQHRILVTVGQPESPHSMEIDLKSAISKMRIIATLKYEDNN